MEKLRNQNKQDLFSQFPGLKDLNEESDNYLLMLLIANNLRFENIEVIEELKDALAFRIVDGIQYEQHIDMFSYPPLAGDYYVDLVAIEKTFIGNEFDTEIKKLAKQIHSKIWTDAFIGYFDRIIEATVIENKTISIDKERPKLPKIPNLNGYQTEINILDTNFDYFQNAYILLHILTGSVPTYIDKYISDGKTDYVLQNTVNILANLLGDGSIGYWYEALDIARSGVIESKQSQDILFAAVKIFDAFTGTQFTDSEFDKLRLIASEFIEEKVDTAFTGKSI